MLMHLTGISSSSENSSRGSAGAGRTVLLLLFLILLMLPPYLVFLGRPSPVRSMETVCMQTSMDTWLRQCEGEAGAWQTPSSTGGFPRIEKPPLLVWLNMIAWRDLNPETATIEQIAWRARLVTVALVMLGAIAACWAGCTLGNPRAGLLAALITGTSALVLKHGHYATYDAQLMGWTALAVAAALWAMQPGRPDRRGRHAAGWLISGIALGAGIMTKGPVALTWVLPPLALAIVLIPRNRLRNCGGLLVTLLLAAALSSWWYLHVVHWISNAPQVLHGEYQRIDIDQNRPLYYYALIVLFILPWTPWWVLSWFQPFREMAPDRRPQLWLAWGWGLGTFALAAAFPMRHDRYLVPLMPALAVMSALQLDSLVERCRHERASPWLRRLWFCLWGVFLAASVIFPLGIALQELLVRHRMLDAVQITGINGLGCCAAALALATLACFGIKAVRTDRFLAATYLAGTWTVLAATVLYFGYAQSDRQLFRQRADAERMAAACVGLPVFYFTGPPAGMPAPSKGLFMFSKRVIRPADLAQLRALRDSGRGFSVMATPEAGISAHFSDFGLQRVLDFDDGRRKWSLFTAVATAAPGKR